MEEKLNLILKVLKLLLEINIAGDYSGVYSSSYPMIESLVKEIDEEVLKLRHPYPVIEQSSKAKIPPEMFEPPMPFYHSLIKRKRGRPKK